MPGESLLYAELKRELRWPWLRRVENRVDLGTPDLDFIATRNRGWIELKREFQLKPENLVALRKEQVAWHASYALAGGLSWIILQAGASYFLWPGREAVRVKSQPLRISADLALFFGDKVSFYKRLAEF